MIAAAKNADKTTQLLLRAGGNKLEAININGITSLIFASRNNDDKTPQLLLSAHDNKEAKTAHG